MLLLIGLFIVAAYLGYFYYTRVHLTKQAMEYYRRQLEKAGYRVKFLPFKLYSFGPFDQLIVDQSKHRDPNYTLQNNCQEYDLVVASCFNIPMIQFYSADLIQAFYTSNINNYVKFEPFVGNVRRILGNGMAFSEGDDWKKKRRIISSVFHFDFLNSLVPKMNEMIDERFQQLDQSQPGEEKKPGLLVTFYGGILGNFMMRFFFGEKNVKGKKLDGLDISTFLNKLMGDVNTQNFELPAVLFGMKFLELGLRAKDRDVNRRIRLFRSFAFDLIKRRVAELDEATAEGKTYHRTGDLIESLYLAKSLHDKTKTDDVYDYMELIEEFCTFFVAGTDTTSHLLTMICLYLEKNPAVKAKLIQEIDEVIPTEADISSDNLKKLHYTQAVINETGRMYGPGTAIFSRHVVKDHAIKEVQVKTGTLVNVCFIPNNYNPTFYVNPHEFNPDRWLNQNKAAAHPFMFVPFSSGSRNCIGQHLAAMEIKLILVKLTRLYDWHIERPEQVSMKLGFLTYPTEFTTVLRRKQPLNEASPS